MARLVTASIDLAAFRHNYWYARQLAGDSAVMAIVKANAYGHGAVTLARALPDADAFGVACLEEALELRSAGITRPILLLGGAFDGRELDEIVARGLETVIHTSEQLEQLVSARLVRPVNVWLKLDTGMHRLGFPVEEFRRAYEQLSGHPNVGEIRLMTHFACADEAESDFTCQQIQSFQSAIKGLDGLISLANSAALMNFPDSLGDWVRPGIMLYGSSPFFGKHPKEGQLVPVMTLTSRIIGIRQVEPGEGVGYGQTWSPSRPAKIATVAIGYADGYPRHASNGAPVAVNGVSCQVVGRVSMDMLTVDVTEVNPVRPGDSVELWGRQVSVDAVATHAGTIGYELLSGLTRRVSYQYSE